MITRDDAERRRREAAEHLDGCRKVKSRGLQAAPGGDSVRDSACYSAYSEADKIRAVLAGNMATRMPAPTINKLQARLAGLEAQIGWR